MQLYPPVFAELNKRQVRYVVVGGLAAVMHGRLRLTMDADIVVALDEANARAAVEALQAIGLIPRLPVDPLQFALEEVRKNWVAEKHLMVFTMIHPSNPLFAVDLFVDPPITFQELSDGVIIKELDGVPVPVCSVAHLIRMKRLSARPEDLADIQILEDIHGA
ncbi:MAG: hypothetical protein WAO58_01540 [Fimbriimonadaceae bacterium]